jgi:hypothetical protein
MARACRYNGRTDLLVLAHAGHWLPQLTLAAPLAVLLRVAAVNNRRRRTTAVGGPEAASQPKS